MNTTESITRECRLGGQGLIAGREYEIIEIRFEIISRDMIITTGTVRDIDGTFIDVKNMHIAFNIDDVIDQQIAIIKNAN